MQRVNTLHITVFETHGLPPAATYLSAHCGGQKVKLANLEKGRLVVEAGNTLVGVEAAEAVWLHAYDTGMTFDASLGSVMLLLSTLDLGAQPFEGWLPLVTMEGRTIGRVAVQIFGDWAEHVGISVVRGTVGERVDIGEPFVEVRLRGDRKRTTNRQKTRTPAWEERFPFFVGTRDKVYLTLFESEKAQDEKYGTAEVLGVDLLKRKGESMWVQIVNKAGQETARVLVAVEEEKQEQHLPVRVLQVKGLAVSDLGGSPVELYVAGKCNTQDFQTTAKSNATDTVWDEEFLLQKVRQFDACHLLVKEKGTLLDEVRGEAFIPVSELLAHSGEQVWVDLTGGKDKHPSKILIWIQPPPGSVYPDTLSRRALVAYEEWDNSPKAKGFRLMQASGPRDPKVPAISYVDEAPAAAVFTPEVRPLFPSKTRGGYDAARDYRLRI